MAGSVYSAPFMHGEMKKEKGERKKMKGGR
jgi:hypothetical protein